jgi:hypothetical protein
MNFFDSLDSDAVDSNIFMNEHEHWNCTSQNTVEDAEVTYRMKPINESIDDLIDCSRFNG